MAFSVTNSWTCMDDGLMQGTHLRLADLGTVIGWQNDASCSQYKGTREPGPP